MSDQPFAEATSYTTQTNTQETSMHTLNEIQTLDSINQAAADLRLRSHGYRDRR